MFGQFAKYCISHGAVIAPLETQPYDSGCLGLCNPSVLIDNNKTRLIIRNVNFALWCCDDPAKFTSPYGPLCYMTRSDEWCLRTRNFLCELHDNELEYKMVDTSKNDYPPVFEMAGHEDMRLVRWNGKLYGTGVQRDWDESGTGRMHLSWLDENTGEELSRVRIKAPGDDSSYCEKNWMPILDMPFHYVKWCNPLEIVRVDPNNGNCETVVEMEVPADIENLWFENTDIRGSSQVIPWGDKRIAIIHRCRLWFNEKNQKSDVDYTTQFIVWDSDWNIVRISDPFKFAGFSIEFTNGLAYDNGTFMIPFALQDNMCFMLSVDEDVVSDFIFDGKCDFGRFHLKNGTMLEFFDNTCDSYGCMDMGMSYYWRRHYAASFVLLHRACEYNTFRTRDELYECMYWCGMSLASLEGMDEYEKSVWMRMIDTDPFRSEAYVKLAEQAMAQNDNISAHTFAKLAYIKNNYKFLSESHGRLVYYKSIYGTERFAESEQLVSELIESGELDGYDIHDAELFLETVRNNKEKRYRLL